MSPTPVDPSTSGTSPAAPEHLKTLSRSELKDAIHKLSITPMFRRCSRDDLASLARNMHKLSFDNNDLIVRQNNPADQLVILASGEARRVRRGRDGVERFLENLTEGPSLTALSVTSGVANYTSAKCVSPKCSAYVISRKAFRDHIFATPRFATAIIESLSDDFRVQSRRFRTPLLAQRTSNDINFAAVSVAAASESYYRSALNSILNQQLTGISAPLFPSMHVQVPARVAYINGFKGLRTIFDRNIDADQWIDPVQRNLVRFFVTVAPGVIMTPISSILEACNVSHINSEPLLRRSSRGFLPRMGREVVFGVGLNQLSDYFEERFRSTVTPNPVLANTAGSLTAGVAAGYFSHVPHNISTLKLLNPEKPYSEIFEMFVKKSVPDHLVPRAVPKSFLPATRATLACLFPKGILVRTVQICGSFAILNGIIQLIEGDNRRRMRKAIEAATKEDATT